MRPELIDTPERLAAVGALAAQAAELALDTESNSLHAWREKVCVLQLAIDGRVFIVDTVALRDLEPLRPALEAPHITKLLHGADYDVVCLKRDFGIAPRPLFDTMLAAQMLGHEAFGLAAVVERFTGQRLQKAHTKHDWGARPLQEEVIPYLVEDVLHLGVVARHLNAALKAADIEEEFALECRRVEALAWNAEDRDDPEAWRRMKGLRHLDPALHGILRELFQWREQRAQALDRPVFKVLGNDALLEVSARAPRTRRELAGITGLPPRQVERHGHALLQCVQRGLEQPAAPLPRPARRAPRDLAREECEESLRDWRRQLVQSSGLNPMVILPNHVLLRLAELRPADASSLRACPGLGERRAQRYGDALLTILRKCAGDLL